MAQQERETYSRFSTSVHWMEEVIRTSSRWIRCNRFAALRSHYIDLTVCCCANIEWTDRGYPEFSRVRWVRERERESNEVQTFSGFCAGSQTLIPLWAFLVIIDDLLKILKELTIVFSNMRSNNRTKQISSFSAIHFLRRCETFDWLL